MLTPREILEESERLPPFQQKDALKHYVDLDVDWEMKLSSATAREGNAVYLFFALEGYTAFATCTVNLLEYPELRVIKAGAKFGIQGKIESVDPPYFRLNNVKLESIKNIDKEVKQETVNSYQGNIHRPEANRKKEPFYELWYNKYILLPIAVVVIGGGILNLFQSFNSNKDLNGVLKQSEDLKQVKVLNLPSIISPLDLKEKNKNIDKTIPMINHCPSDKDINLALSATDNVSGYDSRDNYLNKIVDNALCKPEYNLAFLTIAKINGYSSKDLAYTRLVVKAIETKDYEIANKASDLISGYDSRDKAKGLIVETLSIKN